MITPIILYSVYTYLIWFISCSKDDNMLEINSFDGLLFNVVVCCVMYIVGFILSMIISMFISMFIISLYSIDIFGWKLIFILQIIVTNLLRISDMSIYIEKVKLK